MTGRNWKGQQARDEVRKKMLIKISGKEKAIKDLEKAEKLINEAHGILWRLPSEIGLEATEGSSETNDSAKVRYKEFNPFKIVQRVNEAVDEEYEAIKEHGKTLEEIEKLHQQIRFEEPYLAEYIKKRMLCHAKEKGDLP